MNLEDAIDLTHPPFTLTIRRSDDGTWDQHVIANGVPLVVGVIGLLVAAENGMQQMCDHAAELRPMLTLIREEIARHAGGDHGGLVKDWEEGQPT